MVIDQSYVLSADGSLAEAGTVDQRWQDLNSSILTQISTI